MGYLDVCSGISAPTVAWKQLGWSPAGFAEIEKFPSAVLAHHYPDVSNLGDITAGDFVDRARERNPDGLVGGTPCQAFSVAGLGNSLADKRGQLTLRYVEILHGCDSIRWAVWENVPGVLFKPDNPFGCFLAAIIGAGQPLVPSDGIRKWSRAGAAYGPKAAVAWRVLDAQYFGLAQRRKRVFVVVRVGAAGFDPAKVLLECEGVRRDSPPSREAGQVAPTPPARSSAGGGLGTDFDCGGTVAMAHGQANAEIVSDGEPSLTCNHEAPIVFDTTQITSPGNYSDPKPGDPTHPLAAGAHAPAVAFSCKDYGADAGAVAPTMRAMGHGDTHANGGGQIAVAYQCHGSNVGPMGTLRATESVQNGVPFIGERSSVRRLTPRECEALQGFPRDYTLVPHTHGKPAADGPRYKALGNAMATVKLLWIGRRLQHHLDPTHAH